MSVLAAANPKFGRFDRYKAVAEQIDLPSPILSRFDLTFILEDTPNIDNDREIAKHILDIHKENKINYDIEPEILRKYIAYARKNCNPQLTEEANKVLEEFYVTMRSGAIDDDSPVPITARQLEAVIRLAEASAKIKLKDYVEAEDAHKAIKLQQACLKEVGYDPETGKIDIDRVEGGTPKSERDKFGVVLKLVEELQAEFNGEAPRDVLNSRLEDDYDISTEKTDEMIKNLKSRGVLFEPKAGYIKKV